MDPIETHHDITHIMVDTHINTHTHMYTEVQTEYHLFIILRSRQNGSYYADNILYYGNQSWGCLKVGRPLWPPAVPRLAARPSQSNPRGLGQRYCDLRNQEFRRWGSSGPSSLMKIHFLSYGNFCALFQISLTFVHLIYNNSALVQIMAWRWTGDKPSSEPMMV